MLLFIQRETEVICSEVPVSIHLMLLFIEVSGVGSAVVEAFQYISCYSLSTSDAGIAVFFCVSIHLMLLFIYPLSFRLFKSKMFQYISCYSLSQQLLRQIFREDCFNTSHVTLYQKIRFMVCSTKNRFNTSHVTLYRILPDKSAFIPFGFNTSHVTLYQNIRLTRIKLSVCFNTSHVTLYQHDQEDVMQKLMFQYISCYSLS